jgi:very-short-patch-repair endonuclease
LTEAKKQLFQDPDFLICFGYSLHSRGEWVIEYQKIPDLLDHIFYNLWHSCIFNGQRPPSRFFYDGDQRNLPILEEDWSLPPFPEISPIQRLLRDALDVAGAEYEMEYMVHPYRLDFAIRGDKVQLDIECDGRAYHTSPEQVERDRIRNNALTEQGWIVLRYSGSQIYNKPYGCVGQILRALETHGESVRDYPLDDSGAFVPPPMADSVVEQANAAVRQKQLEDQLRLMEALEAERQAILNNPEYAEKRKLVSEMISSLAQRFSDPASLKPNV